MNAVIRRVAISALLMLVAVVVFVPISPVRTAATTDHETTSHETTYHETTAAAPTYHPTATYETTDHEITYHPLPRVITTATVPHTHTRWTDPSPPYPWPPPGYSPPPAGYCDPNDPYSYCWDPQCAPQCGYQAVVTESDTTIMTSVVTAPPSTVVVTQTQPQTTVFTQPPSQTVVATQPQDYTLSALAIIAAAVIVGLLMNRRIRRPVPSTAQPGLLFCKSCGKQIPMNSRFCEFCGSAQ